MALADNRMPPTQHYRNAGPFCYAGAVLESSSVAGVHKMSSLPPQVQCPICGILVRRLQKHIRKQHFVPEKQAPIRRHKTSRPDGPPPSLPENPILGEAVCCRACGTQLNAKHFARHMTRLHSPGAKKTYASPDKRRKRRKRSVVDTISAIPISSNSWRVKTHKGPWSTVPGGRIESSRRRH
jgi:hypothetical protein